MPTLVIRQPDGSEQELELGAELTIGRAEGNDLVLTEGGGVSRKHARFFVDNDEVFVEDVGSANGTFVDGEKAEGAVAVAAGAVVVLGDYEVSLKASKPKRTRSPSSGAAKRATLAPSTRVVPAVKPSGPKALAKGTKPNRADAPQLRGLSGPINGQTFTLKGMLVVGRVGDVDLQVDDDSVSRKHAEIEVRGREVVLRDLGSANGTTVNGVPISDETTLTSGDIIQFGIVELIFETAGGSGVKAMARAAPSAPVARRVQPSRRGGRAAPEEAPAAGSKKRLLLIGGGVVALLFVLVLAKAVMGPPTQPRGGTAPIVLDGVSSAPKVKGGGSGDQLEELLSACRQYSSLDNSPGPNWARAEEACKAALELEPIHREANELMKKIQVGRLCEENLRQAKTLVAASREEEALDFFVKVRPDCGYFLKALAAAKDPVEDVKKIAGNECKQYAANGKWENALKRCELYARLACQLMDKHERQAPPLMKVKLEGPLGRNDWRPKDTLYLNFLKARERVTPKEGPWVCPEIPVFRPPQAGEDPAKRAKEEFVKRYPDPEMGRALGLYFDGKFQEMIVPLQKIQENMEKAKYHEQSRDLLRNMNAAASQWQTGSTEVSNDKPERAEAFFRNALSIDEKLVLGDVQFPNDEARRKEIERRQSFVRKSIIDMMTSSTLQKGRGFADRNDFLKACKVWKLGMSFSKGNLDLLRALANVCTAHAAEVFKTADTCVGMRAVLEYAVDGDKYDQRAIAALAEMKCPAVAPP